MAGASFKLRDDDEFTCSSTSRSCRKRRPQRASQGFACAGERRHARSVAVAGSGKHKCCGDKAAERMAMGIVWIVCPKSGRDMSTDIKTDAVSFAALRFWALTLVCPACGETHVWSHMHGTLRDQQTIH
jgi:hypothetical protein